MTTENTFNADQNNNGVLTAEQVAKSQANTFYDENVSTDIRAELARVYLILNTNNDAKDQEIINLKSMHEVTLERVKGFRNQAESRFYKVQEFLINHIKEDDDANVEEMKELCNEVNIELTKTITVRFTVECEYEYIVPLDFDTDDVTEADFDVSVSTGLDRNDDVEEINYDVTIADFNVEDDELL
jgi:CRISPR/Cas system CSM-associated protein Csm2 small subunit